MERGHIRWLPLVLAALYFGYQYFSSEKFVNPETGRKSHVGMSVQQETALGFQTYRQGLSEARTIGSGPSFEMVKTDANKMAAAHGKAGQGIDSESSLLAQRDVR